MTDAFAEIAVERAEAQRNLEAAEAAMKAASRDPRAFEEQKTKRLEAVAALERLDWAEKAEQERQVAAARQAKLDKLHEMQDNAREAHERVRAVSAELAPLLDQVVEKIRALQKGAAAVRIGAEYETYEVRAGLLDRPTLQPNVAIDPELGVKTLRAGRELIRLAGINVEVATARAAQGSL